MNKETTNVNDGYRPINEGYRPTIVERGYQPPAPQDMPTGDGPQTGYTPTSNEGGGPTSVPTPPGDE